MNSKVKTLLKSIFIKIGGCHILRKFNKTPRVLFWHGVDNVTNSSIEAEILDVNVFTKQIDYLEKYYEIISIEEFEERYKNKTFSGREVVLTFDDGYANNLYVVAEILHKKNLPYTVFVSTEHVESGIYFPTSINRIITKDISVQELSIPSKKIRFSFKDFHQREIACQTISDLLKKSSLNEVKVIVNELISNISKEHWRILQEKYKVVRPMNWEEVKLLSEKGATIGSHCMWHICCHSNQNISDVSLQIIESKKKIQEKISKNCKYFAYPNGDFTVESNDIVAKTYSMGFSTKKQEKVDYKNDISVIPRMGVPNDYATFQIMLSLYP